MTCTLRNQPRWSVLFPKPIASMEREMDQLVNYFFTPDGARGSATVQAPANLWEEEGNWHVEVELPGIKQEDIDVTLEKNTLRIAAERKAPEGERKFWHQERSLGRVERVFTLPQTVDQEGIDAELRDGVLYLRLAKKPEAQPKRIGIRLA